MAVRLTNEKLSDLKEAFMLFDYNKDGLIYSQDIAALIRAVGLKPSQQEIQDICQVVSNDGGEVDLQTLVSLISQKVTNPTPEKPEDFREMFRMYDKDGRGYISIEEMVHLLTNVGEKLTDEEAADLLKLSGCVERGMVNYDKFVRTIMS